jgi:hypothetical protein
MRSQAFAAALIGAALIGCGSSAWAAPPTDACSLVRRARVSDRPAVPVN